MSNKHKEIYNFTYTQGNTDRDHNGIPFKSIGLIQFRQPENAKYQRGCVCDLLHCWWDYNMIQLLWKTICCYFVQLNICKTYDLSSIPGILQEKFQLMYPRRHVLTNQTACGSIVHNGKIWGITQMAMNKKMSK